MRACLAGLLAGGWMLLGTEARASAPLETIVGPDASEHRVIGVLGVDRDRDLALLQVEGAGHTALPLGNSLGIKTGTSVGVMGAPLGLSWTLSHGTISAVEEQPMHHRTMEARSFDRVLQVSGTMMGKGNSGSPVFDMGGAVIGVVWGGIGDQNGVSFAVPVEAVRDLLARAASTPTPLVAEREGRILSERNRNLLLSLGLVVLVGGVYAYRVLRRRALERKLAALRDQMQQLEWDA